MAGITKVSASASVLVMLLLGCDDSKKLPISGGYVSSACNFRYVLHDNAPNASVKYLNTVPYVPSSGRSDDRIDEAYIAMLASPCTVPDDVSTERIETAIENILRAHDDPVLMFADSSGAPTPQINSFGDWLTRESGSGGGSGRTGGSAGEQMSFPGRGQLGDPCVDNSNCRSDICLTALPSGYCSALCQTSDTCGENGSCWNLGEQRFCLKNCSSSTECRSNDGYICDGDDTCFPGDSVPETSADWSVADAYRLMNQYFALPKLTTSLEVDAKDTGASFKRTLDPVLLNHFRNTIRRFRPDIDFNGLNSDNFSIVEKNCGGFLGCSTTRKATNETGSIRYSVAFGADKQTDGPDPFTSLYSKYTYNRKNWYHEESSTDFINLKTLGTDNGNSSDSDDDESSHITVFPVFEQLEYRGQDFNFRLEVTSRAHLCRVQLSPRVDVEYDGYDESEDMSRVVDNCDNVRFPEWSSGDRQGSIFDNDESNRFDEGI